MRITHSQIGMCLDVFKHAQFSLITRRQVFHGSSILADRPVLVGTL